MLPSRLAQPVGPRYHQPVAAARRGQDVGSQVDATLLCAAALRAACRIRKLTTARCAESPGPGRPT